MKTPYVATTVRSLKFKNPINGFDAIPEGAEITLTWEGIRPKAVIPAIRPEQIPLSNKGVALLLGFSVPDMETLEEWHNDDGGCESVLGEWVEPDGYDQYGSPSWMLTLGLI